MVAYDVTDDRRRARLADRLLDFLPRVQKSVFEGEVPSHRVEALRQVVRELIDPETDAVRIYRLCRGCASVVEAFGAGVGSGQGTDEIVG